MSAFSSSLADEALEALANQELNKKQPTIARAQEAVRVTEHQLLQHKLNLTPLLFHHYSLQATDVEQSVTDDDRRVAQIEAELGCQYGARIGLWFAFVFDIKCGSDSGYNPQPPPEVRVVREGENWRWQGEGVAILPAPTLPNSFNFDIMYPGKGDTIRRGILKPTAGDLSCLELGPKQQAKFRLSSLTLAGRHYNKGDQGSLQRKGNCLK
ncbi:hypothetical protein BDP27DRAFT_1402272 [Rhodocollybia butyracea]|uniref:Uncharacterized protein n=1 Tax=Rhodocollybia butyracea TaxID=206335 RepID=A0A9P5PWW4_9AGAR|nr:hypothetical protein BDP27DRAFT_1402272 [Rhodocollybia butyracea]